MRKDEHASWTIRRREAYESLTEIMWKHQTGACDDQAVKDELFKFRHEFLPILERVIRLAKRNRDRARLSRPKVRKYASIQRLKAPSGSYFIPHDLRDIHGICLYLHQQDAKTLPEMADRLARGRVVTADGNVWTIDRLRDALNPSDVWTLLQD